MNKLIVLSLLLSACFYQGPTPDAASGDVASSDTSQTTPDASSEAAIAQDGSTDARTSDASAEAAAPDSGGVCTGCFEGDTCYTGPQNYDHCGFNASCVGCQRLRDSQCEFGTCDDGACTLHNRPEWQRCIAGTERGVCTVIAGFGMCTPCGEPGQRCCTDGTLSAYRSCSGAMECENRSGTGNLRDTCQHCGGLGEQCCAGFTPCVSDVTMVCAGQNTCYHCGGTDEPLCH